ncbi:MAG: hypothetical protein ACI9JD_000829, partial [Rhodococcus sp. (in: high G+C Gram-positive bacteria)]
MVEFDQTRSITAKPELGQVAHLLGVLRSVTSS